MGRRRLFSFLVTLAMLFCSFPVFASQAEYEPPSEISAQSYVLMDAASGELLAARAENDRLPPASTTKIMTALLCAELLDPTDSVTVPAQAVGIEGSSIYLFEGETLSVHDLLLALLLESANDAAIALAIHTAGSVDAFTDLMNEKAKALSLSDTHFTNPHGLPADNHYASAHDLARILQSGLCNPLFSSLIATRTHLIPVSDTGAAHYLKNHNRLLFSCDGCLGGKTGFTKTAGRCLVSAVRRGGATLIAVTLNDPDDWRDHAVLYDTGFSAFTPVQIATPYSVRRTIPVCGGVKSQVHLVNTDELIVSLYGDTSLTEVLYAEPFAYAPVTGLDIFETHAPVYPEPIVAGKLLYYQGNAKVAELPLYFESSVARREAPPTIWERILQFIGWKKSEYRNF